MKAILGCVILLLVVASTTAQRIEPIMLDEWNYLPCDDYLGRMDTYIQEARDNPGSKMYVLIYEGKEPRYNAKTKKVELVNPKFGSAAAKFRTMKQWLRHREFPTDRFEFVKAGYREQITVEIWRVPPGAALPKLNPTLSKILFTKGKATGYCIDCCGP
jgi:hypothetical protein